MSYPLAAAAFPNQGALTDEELFWTALSVGGMVAGVYHGYLRNHGSAGWAIGWGLFGGALPILAIPLMLVEGFGQPE